MNITIDKRDELYLNGIKEVLLRTNTLNEISKLTINASRREESGFKIEKKQDIIKIKYSELNYFYQALLELLVAKDNVVEKTMTVDKLGLMLDFARNSVMNEESLKDYLSYLTLFGYTYCKLYIEDLMKIENEGLFGYMRGSFSEEEFKEIVTFANSIGIEIVPCIQTLAHLNQIFRYTEYHDINDFGDILLADEDKTYELIEKMVKFARNTTASKTINIGADEAEMIGFGKYYNKHGYQNRYDIIKKHLEKVIEICEKYNFKAEMWSDMIYKFAHGKYYVKGSPDMTKAKEIVPKNMDLIYWDYYQLEEQNYIDMIKSHKKLVKEPIFAGGIWTWRGYMPLNRYSEETAFPAIEACIKEEVKNVFFTLWGDNGGECSKFSVISTLIQVPLRFQKDYDINKVSQLLEQLTGYTYKEWMSLDSLNDTVKLELYRNFNPSKYILFDDLFTTSFDSYLNNNVGKMYKEISNNLDELANRNSKFSFIFKTAYHLSKTLEHKALLGKNIYKNYQMKNLENLKSDVQMIEKTINELKTFYDVYKNQWHLENKAFGFDVQIIRLGGLLKRLDYVKDVLLDFIDGKIEKIDELEEERRTISERTVFFLANRYRQLVTPSML